jgi:hypothetical protein
MYAINYQPPNIIVLLTRIHALHALIAKV